MTNQSMRRPRGKRRDPSDDDDLGHDDETEEMHLRPASWPRRRRSKKNPTDLEIFKAKLLRQIPVGSDGKKVKFSNRDVLNSLFWKEPMNGTPEQKLLALIELLEELHPSPNPTFATILDINMEPFPNWFET